MVPRTGQVVLPLFQIEGFDRPQDRLPERPLGVFRPKKGQPFFKGLHFLLDCDLRLDPVRAPAILDEDILHPAGEEKGLEMLVEGHGRPHEKPPEGVDHIRDDHRSRGESRETNDDLLHANTTFPLNSIFP